MCVGCCGEFVVEFICFGWVFMVLGIEVDLSVGFLVVDVVSDYEKWCVLDVFGLVDLFVGD